MLIEVTEPSQAGEARRRATALAEDLQMGETRCGDVALAVTEIATNLLKHAGRGYILVDRLDHNGAGLRVLGVDKGPGIADVSKALTDGHSTAGSMGTGLGAIRRVSDSFDLYSSPVVGTVVSTEFWSKGRRSHPRKTPIETGVLSEPIRGEDENGDGWGVRSGVDYNLFMVVDGLGHGTLAAEASREAERLFSVTTENSPAAILRDIHATLRQTRGAVGAIARIDFEKRLLSFAGVGNISASIVSPTSSRSMASHNGTLGQQTERVQEFTCPWNEDSILVMHSDGLTTRWDLKLYPGIWNKPPSLIAAVLHRDYFRDRDDVTVLVAKARPV